MLECGVRIGQEFSNPFLQVKNMREMSCNTNLFGGERVCCQQNEKLHFVFIKPHLSTMPVLTFNHQSTPMCFPDPFLVLVRILLKLCSWRKSYHCVHYGLMQDQSILLQGCHCCFAILILISHLFLSTLSLAGIQVSLLTHLIHYLPFPFSPDNNHPTLLRNSQVAKNAFSFLFFFSHLYLKAANFY